MDRKPIGVIEAKKGGTTLSTVADQSARYANSLPAFLAAGLTGTLPFLDEPPTRHPPLPIHPPKAFTGELLQENHKA